MGYTYAVHGDKDVRVHQTLFAKFLCITFLLQKKAADISQQSRWQSLSDLAERKDEMGNGIMDYPFDQLIADGLLTLSELRQGFRLAADWLGKQPEMVDAETFRDLGLSSLYQDVDFRKKLQDVCNKLTDLFSEDFA